MKLLALESATDACSVALSINGDVTTDHRIEPQKHAQLLLPMIDELLIDAGISTAQLDGIAFGCGPGSFTGVRIAAAATQGIAFGADIGVIAVSSLQALAQGVIRNHSSQSNELSQSSQSNLRVFASFDARMDEVYWGVYAAGANGVAEPLQQDSICSPQEVCVPKEAAEHEWALAGSGADRYRDVLVAAVGANVSIQYIADCWPSAQDVLSVAQPVANANGFQSAELALPVYLRDRVALTEAQRAAGEQL
ncbi:MAG: tRNA (adenosine(37)-N6)-threonylcarbamoyltransferase complex dimerization subunit type 1 TsaB [Granulosicoccus sp.]|nr:tRNA (adenosine(37)-N6)-threonylcarbamoyltransferase complex dimerization subunit type 1 TsaB [Granulosicoccus sp.]